MLGLAASTFSRGTISSGPRHSLPEDWEGSWCPPFGAEEQIAGAEHLTRCPVSALLTASPIYQLWSCCETPSPDLSSISNLSSGGNLGHWIPESVKIQNSF